LWAGFDVTLVEMGDQVLGPMDQEMARMVEGYLEQHGVNVVLNDGAAEFRQSSSGALEVHTQSGAMYPADIVVLGIGVRPDTALAKQAGLEIGDRGGIRTDEQMRTSEPDIFAAGDAVEVRDFVTGEWSLVALAGPANRQGRIIADVIAGRDARFRGTQGTAIIGLFEGTAASRRERPSSACSKARQPGPAQVKKPSSVSATRTTRRSICIRILTPVTTLVRNRSR
jgi:NADPH-dependent 2,4-dienoyl-CoA reductase/sulfur reductase-like enzyme